MIEPEVFDVHADLANFGQELRDLAGLVIHEDRKPGIRLWRPTVLARNPGLPRVAFTDELGEIQTRSGCTWRFQSPDQAIQVLTNAVQDGNNLFRVATQYLHPQGGITGGDAGRGEYTATPAATTAIGESGVKRRMRVGWPSSPTWLPRPPAESPKMSRHVATNQSLSGS